MIASYFTILKFVGLYLIVIPVILGASLSLISRWNKQLIVNHWGSNAQILLGGIGVIIHELSHSLAALLFGHRISSIRLLHIPDPHDPTDNSLGSVDHQWNNNSLYQRIGNVFIGIAPIIGNTLALILITNWLMPGILTWFRLNHHSANFTWWKLLLWLFLAINISIGGFDLSSADLQNSASGLVTFVVLILIASLFANFVTSPAELANWLHSWLSWVYLALSLALVIDLAILLFLHLLTWRE